MARPRRVQEESNTNGLTAEQINGFFETIDDADAELLSLKSDYMNLCKSPRGRVRDVMLTAKECGANLAAFRLHVKRHRAERKIAARLAELEADDRAEYDRIRELLGGLADTPLGEAALSRHSNLDELQPL